MRQKNTDPRDDANRYPEEDILKYVHNEENPEF